MRDDMRVLITGADGQLAREFRRTFEYYPHDVIALTRSELDITDPDQVRGAFDRHHPDIVLNCAAYNFVDKAEEEPEGAFRVNAHGVRNLAKASKEANALLVHYSSDYVFDGAKEDFYTEEDVTRPLNTYGKSKLAGEAFLREETDDFILFRVSWVFGDGRQNFFAKLIEWTRQKRVIKIVCDQISVPTFARDIAHLTLFAINKGLRGLYHLTNSGYASRYEVARFFLEKAGIDVLVLPVHSDYFPSPARRPYFSAMSNAKISRALDVEIPDWRISVESHINTLFKRENT